MPRLTTRDSQRCWDIPGLKCKLCSYSTHRTRSKILKIKLRNISLYTDLQDLLRVRCVEYEYNLYHKFVSQILSLRVLSVAGLQAFGKNKITVIFNKNEDILVYNFHS